MLKSWREADTENVEPIEYPALDGNGDRIACPNGAFGYPCVSDGEYTYALCRAMPYREARYMMEQAVFGSHVSKFLVISQEWQKYKLHHKMRRGLRGRGLLEDRSAQMG